jgi:hypothetical protein
MQRRASTDCVEATQLGSASQAVAAPNGSGGASCGDRPVPPPRPCASLLPAASGVAGTGAIENEAQQQQQQQACVGTPYSEDKEPLEDSC